MQKCPQCGSVMIPLFTSFVCKDECDKNQTIPWKRLANSRFVYKLLKQEEIIPRDATHGWWVMRRSFPKIETDEEVTSRVYNNMGERVRETGGWPIEERYIGNNELTYVYNNPESSLLMVTKLGF